MHVHVDLYVLICQIGLKCHLISIFNILSMYMYHLTRVLQVWLKGFIGNTSSKKDHLRPNYTPLLFSLFTLLLYYCSSTFISSQHNMFKQVIFTHIYSLSLAESSCPKKQGFSFIFLGCVQLFQQAQLAGFAGFRSG